MAARHMPAWYYEITYYRTMRSRIPSPTARPGTAIFPYPLFMLNSYVLREARIDGSPLASQYRTPASRN